MLKLFILQLTLLAVSVECMLAPFLFNQIKNGRCPRKGDIDSMNVCIQTCENDFSCEKDQICCPTECDLGYVCIEKGSEFLIGKKPGKCPRQKGIFNPNQATCLSDYSCRGNQKCCNTVTGTRCVPPIFNNLPSICPDFSGLQSSPCNIGFTNCQNQRDCQRGETCCQYGCGGLCIKSK